MGTVLEYDNSRPKRHTTQFLADSNVKILSRAFMSPDLNLNKHTWNELERRVRGRMKDPANVHELFQALKQGWLVIPVQVIQIQ